MNGMLIEYARPTNSARNFWHQYMGATAALILCLVSQVSLNSNYHISNSLDNMADHVPRKPLAPA
eukprot:scaffold317518_cov28-Prasinocladus_malaysianus.AAC.1